MQAETVIDAIETAPKIDHPLGDTEILSPQSTIMDVIDGLQERGLLIESEFVLGITPEGTTKRVIVKSRPREGFLSKLLQ